ncbi:MAG: Uma2 family endonuclease [Ruminococcus sp.]|nr:Uma2 family endonuclease [Ruminococcus sp.]
MPIPRDRMTAEEFFRSVPETNEQCELIYGEIVSQAAPNRTHQRIASRSFSRILDHIETKGGKCEPFIAPFDVVLNEDTVVQPDVFVVCVPDKVDEKRMYGAPDLVIEVISTNRRTDTVIKLELYKNSGVREYWIIDPESERTLVYLFGENTSINIYTFDQPVPVGIYNGELEITVGDMV